MTPREKTAPFLLRFGMCSSAMMNLLNIGKNLIKENGLRWTFLYVLYWSVRLLFKRDLRGLYATMVKLEGKHNLPGFNSPATAGDIWDLLPWDKKPEEKWTISSEWKKGLVDEVLLGYIKPGSMVLEVGPGSGRWTEILQTVARELFVVDVSARAIDICKKRFSSATNIRFMLARNANLGIPDKSIDAIWSFDVFVHFNPDDTAGYLAEFKRVLVPGGIGIIHHPVDGGIHGGWRSRMTGSLFTALLEKNGLTMVRRFDSWGENGRYNLSHPGDCISVFTA